MDTNQYHSTIKCYIIEEHCVGCNRFLSIRNSDNLRVDVHFVGFEEFLMGDSMTNLRHVRDSVCRNLYIDLVFFSYKMEEPIRHAQKEKFSVEVDAVVRVMKIIVVFTLLAESDIEDQIIRSEFEHDVDQEVNDFIFLRFLWNFRLMN